MVGRSIAGSGKKSSMKYLNPKFSLPIASTLTDREYEIRVGARCAKCEELRDQCTCLTTYVEPEALQLLKELHDRR